MAEIAALHMNVPFKLGRSDRPNVDSWPISAAELRPKISANSVKPAYREARPQQPARSDPEVVLLSHKEGWDIPMADHRSGMGDKTDVWQGTLALMVLKTLATMGAQHGYGLARRIEQTSGDKLSAELRHHLPRPAQAGAGRRHRRRVGHVREQPAGQVLHADARRAPAAREGRTQLGGHDRDPRPLPRAGACGTDCDVRAGRADAGAAGRPLPARRPRA